MTSDGSKRKQENGKTETSLGTIREISEYVKTRRGMKKNHLSVRDGKVYLNDVEITTDDASTIQRHLDLSEVNSKGELSSEVLGILRKIGFILETQSNYFIKKEFRKEISFYPPIAGEKILYMFLPKEERDYLPGDLAEEASMLAAKFGATYAKNWYWKQVITSVGPIILRAIRRLAPLATLIKLYDYVRGIF